MILIGYWALQISIFDRYEKKFYLFVYIKKQKEKAKDLLFSIIYKSILETWILYKNIRTN